eukprot:7484685-Ditylum_brightwellii.AAC.1
MQGAMEVPPEKPKIHGKHMFITLPLTQTPATTKEKDKSRQARKRFFKKQKNKKNGKKKRP